MAIGMLTFLRLFVLGILVALLPGSTSEVAKYTAQIRAYADSAAWSKWKNFTGSNSVDDYKTEIRSMFVEAREIYKSLRGKVNLDMDLEILDIIVMTETLVTPLMNRVKAIYAANEWIGKQQVQHDLSIMFIGNSMLHQFLGVAFTSEACTKKAVGVMTYTGTFDDAIILAHEMGHLLGSNHDASRNKTAPCYLDNGKVMNSQFDNNPRATNFEFSECSGKQINTLIKALINENLHCLHYTGNSVIGHRLGSLMSADEMCRRKYGSSAFVNNEEYVVDEEWGSELCLKLHCLVKNDTSGVYYKEILRSPPGMICGQNKECIQGKCVSKDDGRTVTPDICPLGDQLYYMDQNDGNYVPKGKCNGMDKTKCSVNSKACCQTCNSGLPVSSTHADDVCKQLVRSDTAQLNRGSYTYYNDKFCSGLNCISTKNGEFVYHTFNTPDGLACGKNKLCNKGKCQASDKKTNTPDECPYGDIDTVLLGYSETCASMPCATWKYHCCKSCSNQ